MRIDELLDACALVEAPLAADLRQRRYYHGTSTSVAAAEILRVGLRPGMPTRYRGALRPRTGRLYITPRLDVALLSALGRAYHNRTLLAREPFGYLFVIPGAQIGDAAEPDEDSIGHFMCRYGRRVNSGAKSAFIFQLNGESVGASEYAFCAGDCPDANDLDAKRQVWTFVAQLAPRDDFQRMMFHDESACASIGKRAVRKMPDWMQVKLVEWGANIAYSAVLRPSECWRIAKQTLIDSQTTIDFFSRAERIA